MDPKLLERWRKAVVHLEGTETGLSSTFEIVADSEARRREPPETMEQMIARLGLDRPTRVLRHTGTATFVTRAGGRYLVTARHVLRDEEAVTDHILRMLGHFETADPMDRSQLVSDIEHARRSVFSFIFRVPGLDEVLAAAQDAQPGEQRKLPELLGWLGAGVPDMHAYTYAPQDLDLGVVSLDQHQTTAFGDELIALGYEPIPFEEVFVPDIPSPGAEVFTVGFPARIADIGTLQQAEGEANWSSSTVSIPTYAFGRVAMAHDELPWLWADMTIAPGNSGGPVVDADGRWIGVVSAQPVLDLEGQVETPDQATPPARLQMRFPFAKVVRTLPVPELLESQAEKTAKAKSFRGP